MKAISLWEPWASAMAMGAKRIETRSWPTSYRGPLLICASKRPMDAVGQEIRITLADHGFFFTPRYGMAVCVVDLIRCDVIAPYERDGLEYELGDFTPGRYAWTTANVRPVMPFAVSGRQGLFEVDTALVNQALEWTP